MAARIIMFSVVDPPPQPVIVTHIVIAMVDETMNRKIEVDMGFSI
jgi:multisubunit Na+/H+ antiporter MnhC subunit